MRIMRLLMALSLTILSAALGAKDSAFQASTNETGEVKMASKTKRLKCLDLFSGAGGFSLGFTMAGCEVIGAVEIDKWACEGPGGGVAVVGF